MSQICSQCGKELDASIQFCPDCGEPVHAHVGAIRQHRLRQHRLRQDYVHQHRADDSYDFTDYAPPRRLIRPLRGRKYGGVCAALARASGLNLNAIRILFSIACAFYGSGFILYILLWMLIPAEAKPEAEIRD